MEPSHDELLHALNHWRGFTALVVGDFMLDQLVYGDAERLSPDAPVPILHVRRTEDRAGGAANVCIDLIALRARVLAFGVTGDDEHAARLRKALTAEGVECGGLVCDPSRPTTVKQSLIGLAQARHPQKMFRVDHESREPLSPEVVGHVLRRFDEALAGADVVCVEDYAKGVCTPELCQELIRRCKAAGKPVLVDPAKLTDYGKYRGATVITPNRTEAEFASGLATDAGGATEHNTTVARSLLESLELEAVVLTLDRHGALLLTSEGRPVSVPTVAREVYDVTGAGDMFLAGLAASRANGIGWESAVRFANAAAGLEVEVFGVQPIPLERVHASLLAMTSGGKERTVGDLLIEIEGRRKEAQRLGRKFGVVFTNGCFDVLHAGHVSLLERAASEGDMLVVGLNSDASVTRLKGAGRPINTQMDRARVLSALKCVDAVVAFTEDTPIELIRSIRPDSLVKGGDYDESRVVGAEFVRSYGGSVVLADVVPGRSTTATVARMQNGRTGTQSQ
jgi:D-beta-D-heptose 7-phosphate kinase/D-beta-D-heptose 1-phosphate adenosyltransferase